MSEATECSFYLGRFCNKIYMLRQSQESIQIKLTLFIVSEVNKLARRERERKKERVIIELSGEADRKRERENEKERRREKHQMDIVSYPILTFKVNLLKKNGRKWNRAFSS